MGRLIEDIATWNYVRDNIVFDEELEYDMLWEELKEFADAKTNVDEVDALADIIFVAIGSLYKKVGSVEKAEAVMRAVIEANFRKGTKKNEAGKIQKPTNFVGPEAELQKIIDSGTESLWGSYLDKNKHIYA